VAGIIANYYTIPLKSMIMIPCIKPGCNRIGFPGPAQDSLGAGWLGLSSDPGSMSQRRS